MSVIVAVGPQPFRAAIAFATAWIASLVRCTYCIYQRRNSNTTLHYNRSRSSSCLVVNPVHHRVAGSFSSRQRTGRSQAEQSRQCCRLLPCWVLFAALGLVGFGKSPAQNPKRSKLLTSRGAAGGRRVGFLLVRDARVNCQCHGPGQERVTSLFHSEKEEARFGAG